MIINRPENVRDVLGEVTSEEDLWSPKTLPEWKEHIRTKAIISAWTAQNADERVLRRTIARWVFRLITIQSIGIFGLVGGISAGTLSLDEATIRWLFGAFCAETFGLAFIVVKYLFNDKARLDINSLIEATK